LKSLVVFYSRTGNTKRVAEMIAGEMKADLQELVDKKSRKGPIALLRAGRDAMKEKTTELEPLRRRPGEYDLILVGTPVWASRPAPAARTFLQSDDLSGKKVALFCTMSTKGGEETLEVMESLLSGAEVIGQLAIAMKKESEDSIKEKVTQWVAPLEKGE
jgi:flavodoxin